VLRHNLHVLLLIGTSHLPQWSCIGSRLERHPFSGLVASKFSFESLLLSPRSALEAVSPGLTPKAAVRPPRPPTRQHIAFVLTAGPTLKKNKVKRPTSQPYSTNDIAITNLQPPTRPPPPQAPLYHIRFYEPVVFATFCDQPGPYNNIKGGEG